MAAQKWSVEVDRIFYLNDHPTSLTYCSTLNCIIATVDGNTLQILDVNSGQSLCEKQLLGVFIFPHVLSQEDAMRDVLC